MTDLHLSPYLHFQDQAREAMAYYQEVFGGELSMQTYAEAGMSADSSNDDRIMHAQLIAPHGLVLMGGDVTDGMPHEPGTTISLALAGDDEALLRGHYDALAEGGTVIEPLEQAPWGDHFGSCVDRFGTTWMVNIGSAPV